MTADHRPRLSGGRLAAVLVAALMVTAVLGPVGLASAQTVSFTQTVQGGDTTLAPGDTFTVEATIDYSDVNSPAIDADIPDGWTVTAHTDDGGTYKSSEIQWIWLEGDTGGVDGTHTVTYTVEVPSDASPGDYTISGEGSAINPADSSSVSATDDLTVTVEDTTTGDDVVFAVNAGGSEYTATDGTTFVDDTNFDGGQTFTSGEGGTPSEPEIDNTDDDQLYWTERFGDFGYDIPVPEDGQYEVTLYFAELYQGVANDAGEGARIFDVSAEGQLILDDYDIIAEAGAPHTAISETATVEVTDGELNLDFTTVEDNAKISAIKVEQLDDGTTNTPPTIDPISDQTVTEGDSTTVPVNADDADGDSVSLSLTQSPDFVTLSNGEITIAPQSGDAADSPYTVEVTADDGTDQTTESFQVTVEEPTTGAKSAAVSITPDSGLEASTYSGGSFQVTNTGEGNIESVTIDLSTTTLPDMVWDPDGTAGDQAAKGLNIDGQSGDGVGVVSTADDDVFSQPHNGVDGDDGYDVLTIEFTDFEPGESVSFSADNDPTSIKGATLSSQEAGPVSGLELARATVSVGYGDGTTQTTQTIGDGSDGGSEAVADADVPAAPSIGAQGVSLDSSVLDDYHSAATVSEASQTITVSGPANADVTLVRVEGELELDNVPDYDGTPGYDIEDYEANKAEDVEYYSATLDSNGEATIPVTLTDSTDVGGLNYFVAAVEDSEGAGMGSNVVVLELEPDAANTPPTVDAITDTGVSQGDSTTVDVSASDDDGDSLTLSKASGPDWVTLTDDGDGTGTLDVAPSTDVAVGTYTVEVTASDGQATSEIEEFAVYVDEPDQDGQVVTAINAGGPEFTAGDGTVYEADSANQYYTGGSTFTTGGSGTPTDPDIANTDDDTLYQSERYGDFSYAIPVSESGTYEVTLQFAEIFQSVSSNDNPDSSGPDDGTNENDRLFDVAIEGQTVVSSYDIFSEVGPLAASDKTYTVEVTDGTLNVAFSTVNDNAKISAIRVEQLDTDDTIDTPIGDFENPPTDPDGDGLYEDVNGDGDVNVGDAQAIFSNSDDPVVQNNVDAFDYNGDGSVNVGDAQALFANGVNVGDA